MSSPSDFRIPDYLSLPPRPDGTPSTQVGRVISVVERQKVLRDKARSAAIGQVTRTLTNNLQEEETSGLPADDVGWSSFDRTYPLLRAFGHPINLGFDEGRKLSEEEQGDGRSVPAVERKVQAIRTRAPTYHLTCEGLRLGLKIRRGPEGATVPAAPSAVAKRAALALESASEETDSLLVGAFQMGRSHAVGIRYAEAPGDDGATTQFFYRQPFKKIEDWFAASVFTSLKGQIRELQRHGENVSLPREPISNFAGALDEANVQVPEGGTALSGKVRDLAQSLT